MADYLLLTNPDICPVCRCKGRVVHFSQCPSCGTLLFTRDIQFQAMENEGGPRSYWVFRPLKGWMHRDHLVCGEKPNEREYKAPKLASDYGRQTTPENVRAAGGKIKLKGNRKPRGKLY